MDERRPIGFREAIEFRIQLRAQFSPGRFFSRITGDISRCPRLSLMPAHCLTPRLLTDAIRHAIEPAR